jgi:NAD(P)-dependent dehydrogenase (short-subunit alcohol dehydrogenase family)
MHQVPDQSGRRVLVTGASSGTGKEAAARLAAAGAHVIMAVRTPAKGDSAREDILKAAPKASLEVRRLDLADLKSVRELAQALEDEGRPIDVLVNNAGVMTPPRRESTRDGFELQFGSNFLGPFALTVLLLPLLLKSKAPRVATMVSSAAHFARINWDDPQWERSYRPMAAYSQSKLADMLMAQRLATLAERRGWGLVSTLAHPGYTRTNLQTSGPNLGTGRTGMPLYMRLFPSMGVSQGTEPLLHAAAEPHARQAAYYGPRWLLFGDTREAKIPAAARRSDPERLWSLAEELTGTRAPA